MLKRVLAPFVRPWSRRAATTATVVATTALFLLLDRSASMHRAEWGVDEGQRIAESYLLRVALRGDFDHPDWFRVITDSSHPQMSKYYFGVAALLAGVELPHDLALPRYYERGGTGWQPPPHLLPVYGPMLWPARRAALLCNILSWMAVTWLLLRGYGVGAVLFAAAIFVRHYLPVTLFAHARSDALQTCTFTLTLLAVAAIWRGARGWRAVCAAILAGVFAAICFQTRLNGLLALGGAGAVLVALAIRQRNRRPLVLAMIVAITCGVVSVGSNPYYWAQPERGQGVPSVYEKREVLPLRVVTRFRTQVAELEQLLEVPAHARYALRSPAARAGFTARVLFSGVAGALIAAGLVAALAMLFVRPRHDVLLLACAWTLPVLLVFALWLPLSWEPYVMLVFPSAVLVAAAGVGTAAARYFEQPETTGDP